MKKIKEFFARIRAFFEEVKVELRKCSWPARPELIESTLVVIVSVVILSAFVGVSDTLLMGLLKMVIQ